MGKQSGFESQTQVSFELLKLRASVLKTLLEIESSKTEKIVILMRASFDQSAELLKTTLENATASIDATLNGDTSQLLYGHSLTIEWILDAIDLGIEGLRVLNGSNLAGYVS